MVDRMPEVSSDRMPCRPSTKLRYNDFVAGLGLRATYDDALNFLLDTILQEGENEFEAGRRLTAKFMDSQESEAGNPTATRGFQVAEVGVAARVLGG